MEYGEFVGEVVTTWLVERESRDRLMRLEADFIYRDPQGREWLAPKGRTVNGASIPSFLWGPVFGSPYLGNFRRASVVHDIAEEDRERSSRDVHRMFFYAMRCDDTEPWLAGVIYAAVRVFGEKWGTPQSVAMPPTQDNIAAFLEMVHSSEFTGKDALDDLDSLLEDFMGRRMER
ncbi:Protein of unknown function [Modicisalibacter ilicicola DSM 19980]|uniref:DUF1353 domain-containing protein n=1 Tax=Modicisalibacter ilicicola DSM 19980 TaxID=1121942 RepID=A0A1M4WGY1_9GAMM|nr:DUF1353 domain-containing protein [Halomonas ilicicola]SHE80437.1 Protein of unknown function [Halomonas ilicicola DSM 19980]